MKQLLAEISKASLNLVFPIHCEGCNIKLPYNDENYLCSVCLAKIKKNRPPFCIRCGRCLYGDEDIKTVCPDCLNKSLFFDKAFQCCVYEGLVKDLIHNFKYGRKLFLKNIFTKILHDFTTTYIDYKNLDITMPVPMHESCINARGFNQAAILSIQISKFLSIPYIGDHLIKTKNTKRQVTLDKKERLANVRGAFSLKKGVDIARKSLLLIDDVFTTGSTVNECSKVLKDAGAKSVYVLAVARGI